MGRVSRYKRIKPCIPSSRGSKRDLRKDDLCPENEDEQPMPKSLLRLMRSAELAAAGRPGRGKRQRRDLRTDSSQLAAASEIPDDDSTAAKIPIPTAKRKQDPMFQRRKGESLKAYLERIDIEANAHIMESFRKNRKMSEKRKTYLQERRKKFKAKKTGDDESPEFDFADMKDEVRFGEVVKAPPRLNAKPRGSHSKQAKGSKQLLLQDKLASNDSGVAGQPKQPSQQRPVNLKRKKDLEVERDRAVQAYRLAKKAKLARTSDD